VQLKKNNHMAKITEVRLTLAALIYGIEIDLKSLINQAISPFHQDLSFLKDKALEQKVVGQLRDGIPRLGMP
jgi:LuxR family glucitol operon transcriptional activator